jgi:hypothetical protein
LPAPRPGRLSGCRCSPGRLLVSTEQASGDWTSQRGPRPPARLRAVCTEIPSTPPRCTERSKPSGSPLPGFAGSWLRASASIRLVTISSHRTSRPPLSLGDSRVMRGHDAACQPMARHLSSCRVAARGCTVGSQSRIPRLLTVRCDHSPLSSASLVLDSELRDRPGAVSA